MKRPEWGRWLATGFGAGYLPIAPGTWGSGIALLLTGACVFILPDQARLLVVLFSVFFTVFGIPASTGVARATGKDPSIVVVDEIAGQFVAFLLIPLTLPWLVAAFFGFRIMDIIKPFPARKLEDLPDGWGIMLDDLVAGFYCSLLLMILVKLLSGGIA